MHEHNLYGLALAAHRLLIITNQLVLEQSTLAVLDSSSSNHV